MRCSRCLVSDIRLYRGEDSGKLFCGTTCQIISANVSKEKIQEHFLSKVKEGDVKAVRELLKDSRVDPSDDFDAAIRWASKKNHGNIIRLLLNDPRVDPSVQDNYVLKNVYKDYSFENVELVKMLLKYKKVVKKLTEADMDDIIYYMGDLKDLINEVRISKRRPLRDEEERPLKSMKNKMIF